MAASKKAYNRKEAAAEYGVSTATIDRAIATGALRAKRTGRDADGNPAGRILIAGSDLDDWFDALDAA